MAPLRDYMPIRLHVLAGGAVNKACPGRLPPPLRNITTSLAKHAHTHTGPATQADTQGSPRRKIRKSMRREDWDPKLNTEYEEYREAPSPRRRQLWEQWSRAERRLVFGVSGVARRAEHTSWKKELERQLQSQPKSQSQSGWKRDLTQEGEVHPNPGPGGSKTGRRGWTTTPATTSGCSGTATGQQSSLAMSKAARSATA